MEVYKLGDEYGIGEFIFKFMKLHSNKVAQIIDTTEEKDTFSDLLLRSIRVALKLQKDDNIQPTDRIGVCTNNHINSCVPFISAQFLGAHAVYFDFYYTFETSLKLMKQVAPKVMIVDLEHLEIIERCIEEGNLDIKLIVFGDHDSHVRFSQYLERQEGEDNFKPFHITNNSVTALIVFSSGTSGTPKAVCLSHYGMIKQRDLDKFVFKTAVDNTGPQPISLMYSSLHWISVQSGLMFGLITGTCRVICVKTEADQLWDLIEKLRINYVFLNPFRTEQFLSSRPKREVDVSCLYGIATGATKMPQYLVDRLRETLPKTFLAIAYGQTECSIIAFFDPSDPEQIALSHKPNSCGKIKKGHAWKVIDVETNKTLGPNQVGELRIKTDEMMIGYYKMDSSEAFDSEGYLKTGDLVYYDEDECIYIVGRCCENFKCREVIISSSLLEEVLLSHPAVAEAAVIPIPDDLDGLRPMGVVVLKKGYTDTTAKEIQEFVDGKVYETQKLKAGVRIVDELPKTSTMKVKKHELQAMILKKS